MTLVVLRLYVDIHDEDALRRQATSQAYLDHQSEELAKEFLDPDSTSVGDCVQMILDPGTIVGGSILESTYEIPTEH